MYGYHGCIGLGTTNGKTRRADRLAHPPLMCEESGRGPVLYSRRNQSKQIVEALLDGDIDSVARKLPLSRSKLISDVWVIRAGKLLITSKFISWLFKPGYNPPVAGQNQHSTNLKYFALKV